MEKDKIKLTFIENTSLKNGGGAVNVALRLIQFLNREEFQITIVETDFYDRIRVDENELKKYIDGVELLSIKGYSNKFRFLEKSIILGAFLVFFIEPIIWWILRNTTYKQLRISLAEQDLIYLFQNNMVTIFRDSQAILMGSTHGSLGRPGGLVNTLLIRLIENGLLLNSIDTFHLFPFYRKKAPMIKRGTNLVLQNGVDTKLFYPKYNSQRHKLRLLYVARLEKCKGLELLLEAFKLIPVDHAELHVVGTGPLENLLRVSKYSNIVYHGLLNDLQLSELFRECDVFVYPTKCDQYPLVVLEALSSGLYCIISSYLSGSFDDFREMGYLSYSYPLPIALATAIEGAINNIEIVKSRKQEIYNYICREYSWSRVAENFEIFIKTILRDSNSNGNF